jgi:MFS family permease
MSSAPAYKTFLRNYYLAAFFEDFVFGYAIYNVFFSIRGMSIFQISLLLGWWAFAVLVFEIPSGALADRWNRKKMLTLAPIIKSACFIIWFFARGNFYLYGLGFLFWALSESFVSGTTQALLYDQLKYAKKTGDYERILGKKTFYSHLALAVSMISGGFIASHSLDWALLFSVIPLLFSAVFASLIKEVPKAKAAEEIRYHKHIKTAFHEIKGNHVLHYLFAYFGVVFVTFGTLEEFDQLYYHLVRLPIFAFGIAGFIWSSLNAVGAHYAYKLKDRAWVFYFFPLLSAVGIIVVARFPSVPIIGLLWFSYFLAAPLQVLIESKIQHNIKGSSRATVTSVNAFFLNLSGALLAPVLGFISKIWNLQAIYLSTGILLFVFAFWVFLVRNKTAAKTANSQGGIGTKS